MSNPRIIIRSLSDVNQLTTSHNIGIKRVLLANEETISNITQIAVTTLNFDDFVNDHFHLTMDEHYYFLDGEGVMMVDDEYIKCYPDLFILVPAGSKHSLKATTSMTFITIGNAL